VSKIGHQSDELLAAGRCTTTARSDIPSTSQARQEIVTDRQNNNPLHGITLESILESLVARYGWPALAREIPIRCFSSDPSIGSSLKFLRKTPWARTKVESLYLRTSDR
jgi:uncharacterized protein (DUF2132 family)